MSDETLIAAVLSRFLQNDENWFELRSNWAFPEVALDGYVKVSAEEMAALQRLVPKEEN